MIVLEIADKHGSQEIKLEFMQRVKLPDLAVMARQLATMVSSGMTILRALYVLEAQTQSKLLKETIVGGAQGRRGGTRASAKRSSAIRRSSTRCSSR